ncbi:MAG: response regulator [Clostridia bacterium]|nr:response regulator [Clostridia bacterium]MDD4048811.1 response regulator [Clostridia bacterium]
METIKLLIADDNEDTRENIRRMLSFDEELIVVGEAANGTEAYEKSKSLQPNVILMDINMPGMDGLAATQKITAEVSGCSVVVISVQGEQEYLRKAMISGARDYLVKPFNNDDLINTVKNAYQMEKKRLQGGEKDQPQKGEVITVFGTKGGVGKTTIAVNLAVLLAKSKQKVVLIDLDFQFGDVAIFLNVYPKRTISELAQEGNELDIDLLESYLIPHKSGVKMLPAPGRPEYAELITIEQVEKIIKVLKNYYDYIIIDTPPHFNETNLSALDLSSQILVVLAMDLATIKNVKLSLGILESLHQKGKAKLVLNRASEDMGITSKDAEETIEFLIAAQVPSEGKIVVPALNEGIPFVLSNPTAKVSLALQNLSEIVIKDRGYQNDLYERKSTNFFRRLFK